MLQVKLAQLWAERIRRRFIEWATRLGLRPAAPPPRLDSPYPDYVICPHCGEPEVEVWSYEKTAHCHNCGRTFEHLVSPDREPERPARDQPEVG